MFRLGDGVYVNDSAEEDANSAAWDYIKRHRFGIVKSVDIDKNTEDVYERQIGVEFFADFAGGHTCRNTCKPKRGHFITAKHLIHCEVDAIELDAIRSSEGAQCHEKAAC